MARYFTHLRERAAIDNFLAGTSQSPVQPRGGPPAGGPPAATITRSEAEDLARPRAGSRRAAATQEGGGVVPATLETPVRR
jgi:hypothetical protein